MENLSSNVLSNNKGIEGKEKKLPMIFKVEISLAEFLLLAQKFKFDKPKQKFYTYFDTSNSSQDAKLFKNRLRLRVALKKSGYFLELKKGRNDKFELSYPISTEELSLINSGTLPEGIIKNKLIALDLLSPVQLVGTTNTTVQKTIFHEGQLFLDKTVKDNTETHYQIEFRSEKIFSSEDVKKLLLELELPDSKIKENKVKPKKFAKTKSKLKRFWTDK